MDTSDVKYMEKVTQYDIMDYIYNSFYNNGWKTTFKYTMRLPDIFSEKKLVIPQGTRLEFMKYVSYCFLSSKNISDKDEAAKYKDKNGISIYFSVVLHWLLVYFGVVNKDRLKFCQGYFRYKTREDLDHPQYRAGMHAWLCYDNSVIDVTIWQQKDYFDFSKYGLAEPIIIGNIPEEMSFVGFEENRSLVKEYARCFAEDSGLTFYQWINFHKDQADSVYNKFIPGLVKNLKEK